MPSPATHYRRRTVLSRQHINRTMRLLPLIPSEKNSNAVDTNEQLVMDLTDSVESNSTTTVTAATTTIIDDLNSHFVATTATNNLCVFRRRFKSTLRDVAAAAMIFKIRRLQNNKDLDILCDFFRVLSVENVPRNMKSIQQQLHYDFNLEHFCTCYYVCSNCGASNSNKINICMLCQNEIIYKLYLCSIKKQIQQLMSIPGFYTKLKEEKLKNIYLFSNTKYGEILQKIENESFTMLINTDGVCTPNKNLSLWPFILILNELPIPDRRYLENVTIAAIIPTGKKPTNPVVETCLQLIYEQLIQLEKGQEFFVKDVDERKILHFYTIASCTDKPAEALMENVVQYNAEYGCPKCFTQGELYHGERGVGAKKVSFTIRVYPFDDYQLRTQEKCCEVIQELVNSSNPANNNIPNRTKKKKEKKKKKKEKKTNLYGHLGLCPLTKLKYFQYGISFLTDSLHTIYSGAYKQLLRLLLDSEYRREPWSLYNKTNRIDELLFHVQIPSTTQRRFRSLKYISKFKASEFRCMFHFGTLAILECMHENVYKNLLSALVTAINFASSDYVTSEIVESVRKLLNYFVQQFQTIFGLRHMSSNIHSLLHVHESLKLMGPLWFYSTFSFEGIDKDLISTVHGTTEFAKQLIRQHILYRNAIIFNKEDQYPMKLYVFNEELLNRKQSKALYNNFVDACYLPKPVSAELYDTSENGIAKQVQSYFKDDLIFYHSLITSNVLVKTTLSMHGKLVADSCISFSFNGDQIKYGLIRAIVRSKEDAVRLFIEELTEKKPGSSRINFKIHDEQFQIPNIFIFKCSNIFYIKHPQFILKKHAIICKPGNGVTVLEYPNLKDGS